MFSRPTDKLNLIRRHSALSKSFQPLVRVAPVLLTNSSQVRSATVCGATGRWGEKVCEISTESGRFPLHVQQISFDRYGAICLRTPANMLSACGCKTNITVMQIA